MYRIESSLPLALKEGGRRCYRRRCSRRHRCPNRHLKGFILRKFRFQAKSIWQGRVDSSLSLSSSSPANEEKQETCKEKRCYTSHGCLSKA